VIASKTFTTQETLTNAVRAQPGASALGDELADRAAFRRGVDQREAVRPSASTRNMFEFWDWVGGRYSLWSAIGLPIALAVGMSASPAARGRARDGRALRRGPAERNMPVIAGLLGVWYANFLGADSHAVIPYDQNLRNLPAYLQQADMESNGKRVTRDGNPVDYADRPGRLGAAGHRRPARLLPTDPPGHAAGADRFHRAAARQHPLSNHHDKLLANCLAQTQALMKGKTATRSEAELRPPGCPATRSRADAAQGLPGQPSEQHRSSSTSRLDAAPGLGVLIALYEHKIFVE
jgi:glucose-6-phosphate isomerase